MPLNEKDEHGLTLDDHMILDACIFGATMYEISKSTGIGGGSLKRRLRLLKSMGHVEDRHDGKRVLWERLGPED